MSLARRNVDVSVHPEWLCRMVQGLLGVPMRIRWRHNDTATGNKGSPARTSAKQQLVLYFSEQQQFVTRL
jgi:hypothetical protein